MESARRCPCDANADRPADGAGAVGARRPAVADGDPSGRCRCIREVETVGRADQVKESGFRDRLSAFGHHIAGADARRASGFPFDGRARLRLSTDRTHGACGATLSGGSRRSHPSRSRSVARGLWAAGRTHAARSRTAPPDRQEPPQYAVPADDPAPVPGCTHHPVHPASLRRALELQHAGVPLAGIQGHVFVIAPARAWIRGSLRTVLPAYRSFQAERFGVGLRIRRRGFRGRGCAAWAIPGGRGRITVRRLRRARARVAIHCYSELRAGHAPGQRRSGGALEELPRTVRTGAADAAAVDRKVWLRGMKASAYIHTTQTAPSPSFPLRAEGGGDRVPRSGHAYDHPVPRDGRSEANARLARAPTPRGDVVPISASPADARRRTPWRGAGNRGACRFASCRCRRGPGVPAPRAGCRTIPAGATRTS